MQNSVPNNQMRAIVMAMAGATVAAVATMFIPAPILGSITGSTGVSELIPAAGAPLGDTARALIAFGAGALTLAILAFVFSRQDTASSTSTSLVPASQWTADDEAPSFQDRLARLKMPSVALPKMPWAKNDDDITELADLPKLRNGDGHPDAPPRRPLVASQDLPVIVLEEVADVSTVLAEPAAKIVEPPEVHETIVMQENAEQSAILQPTSENKADAEPTLAQMVAQLEAAVADRQRQLLALEAVATQLVARPAIQRGVVEERQSDVQTIDKGGIFVENLSQDISRRNVVTSSSAGNDDEMDSALTSALATLRRMNSAGR